MTIYLTGLGKSPCSEKKKAPRVWIKNPLYILNESDHQLITSPKSSKLCSSYWHSSFHTPKGYNHRRINGFEAHSGHFVQVLNVRRSHWIVVSNLGCESNAVNVYDTMYTSIPSSTVDTVARLMFCSSPTVTIRMVEVDLQRISSDCGVLSIAMAFDLLASQAPCVAK